MGMPPGRRPQLQLSTSDRSTGTTTFSDSQAHATRTVAASDTPLNMATEFRLPSPATLSPYMPSPQTQLPPIFPYPSTSVTHARGAQPRPDYLQEHTVPLGIGSPYSLPSYRPGPPLRTEPPPTQSPAKSISSDSPSLVPSASSPRNFELPLSRKRSFDQVLSNYDRHVCFTIFVH
jgi:hypothetical protein